MSEAALDPEECPHDLDAEYLYPSDAEVLRMESTDAGIAFVVEVPCPDCDVSLEVTTRTESVEESALSLPLDDAEDVYD
ncbi:hypothetical protein [Halobaculum magnesiiphilum]|uniref:Uncharacterized protein n=1 Tax=Halobaculum magnesiiphilum TaxID=1017351 RepID=A0A8T8WCQ7_9EURY|nr:hypothetical protein [Halobaculum magnesiiphilum]QZP37543.1 hypothetical protein K6T50_14900 [Halobaculum magnesiiphilum]